MLTLLAQLSGHHGGGARARAPCPPLAPVLFRVPALFGVFLRFPATACFSHVLRCPVSGLCRAGARARPLVLSLRPPLCGTAPAQLRAAPPAAPHVPLLAVGPSPALQPGWSAGDGPTTSLQSDDHCLSTQHTRAKRHKALT